MPRSSCERGFFFTRSDLPPPATPTFPTHLSSEDARALLPICACAARQVTHPSGPPPWWRSAVSLAKSGLSQTHPAPLRCPANLSTSNVGRTMGHFLLAPLSLWTYRLQGDRLYQYFKIWFRPDSRTSPWPDKLILPQGSARDTAERGGLPSHIRNLSAQSAADRLSSMRMAED